MASGMTEAIDWLKLKESQFIKRNETACQTSNSVTLHKEPSVTGFNNFTFFIEVMLMIFQLQTLYREKHR